jgi:hypothetical protein
VVRAAYTVWSRSAGAALMAMTRDVSISSIAGLVARSASRKWLASTRPTRSIGKKFERSPDATPIR